MTGEGTVALLAAIFRGRPSMSGALCAGQAPRFDREALDGETPADRAERLRVARWICQRCPLADRCPAPVVRVPRPR